jgi:hypothetical protein
LIVCRRGVAFIGVAIPATWLSEPETAQVIGREE